MALKQKDALINLVKHLHPDFRYILITHWLEDINWHGENQKLSEQYSFKNKGKMLWLQQVQYANDPASFNYQFIEEHLKGMSPQLLRELQEVKAGNTIIKDGSPIDKVDLINYQFAMRNYQAFSYIFGWGIDNDGWNSKGTGQEFVDELLELIEKRK